MESTSETRDLARHLLAFEANGAGSSGAPEPATLRVYEKLRGSLSTLVGVAGFQSLASRALTAASQQAPRLGALRVAPDGTLQGIGNSEPSIPAGADSIDQDGIIFIASLLELLLMFLGKALTLNLVRSVWRDAAFTRSIRETGEDCERQSQNQ